MPSKEQGKEPKAGMFTSEFFVAVGIIVLATALVSFGQLDDAAWSRWTELVKWAGGGYILSRGISKFNS